MGEMVIPVHLGQFNVLLTIFSEIFILTLGTLLTKSLYSVLIKRRIHDGGSARLKPMKWRNVIPFLDDLAFNGFWEGALIAVMHLLLIILTLMASLEVGSKRSHHLIGRAESRIIVNNRTRDFQWHFGESQLPALAKQGCEEINETHISYRSAMFSNTLNRFSCSGGIFEKSEYIIVIKWNIDEIPASAKVVQVRQSVYNYTTKSFLASNETRIWSDVDQYLEFLKTEDRQFMFTTHRGRKSLEIIKPRFEDMFVYSVNQINHDVANNLAPGIAIARSLSNHLVDSTPSSQFMTGSEGIEYATLSTRGLAASAAAAFLVLFVLPVALVVLRRKVSYIRVDPMGSLGVASLCLEYEDKKCCETLNQIEFGIMDRGNVQHLGILPESFHPVQRDFGKPMCDTLHTKPWD